MKSSVLLLGCALVLCACGSQADSTDGSKAIYRAVFKYLIEHRFGDEKPAMLVVDPASTVYRKDDKRWAKLWTFVRGDCYHGESLSALRDDTCAHFVTTNESSHDLSALLDAPIPVEFLRDEEFASWRHDRTVNHETGDAGSYGRFHARYPRAHAYISVSRPGLSSDGTQALVGVGMGRGSLSAWGGYCLLEYVNGRWTVTGLCVTVIA